MKDLSKYPTWIRNRQLDFIPDETIKRISEREKETLSGSITFYDAVKKHRNLLRYASDNLDTIEKLKKKIKQAREKVHQYRQEDNMLWEGLVPFKERYSFTTSVSKYVVEKKSKKGTKEYEYNILSVNRPNQKKPVNCHLGNEDAIKEFLSKTYPKEKESIRKNWKNFVLKKTGDIREKPFNYIQNLMIENPMAFGERGTLKKEEVFI